MCEQDGRAGGETWPTHFAVLRNRHAFEHCLAVLYFGISPVPSMPRAVNSPLGPFYLPAYAEGVRAGLRELGPHLLGYDPRELGKLNQQMDAAL